MILGQFLFRRDTAANWVATNPVLLSGELGIDTDANQFKIGDGTTVWNLLPFMSTTSVHFVDAEIPTPTVDPKVFTLAHVPSPAKGLQLFCGVPPLTYIMQSGGVDYTLAGNTITFITVPLGGSLLIAWYRY